MTSRKEENKPKRRKRVKELPKETRELSRDEQKKIKGGPRGVTVGIRTLGGGSGD